MKTDITIPNPVFRAAEKMAKRLGISLGDLYTAALTAYIFEHQPGDVTESLDRVYAGESSTLEPELVKMQITALEMGQW